MAQIRLSFDYLEKSSVYHFHKGLNGKINSQKKKKKVKLVIFIDTKVNLTELASYLSPAVFATEFLRNQSWKAIFWRHLSVIDILVTTHK